MSDLGGLLELTPPVKCLASRYVFPFYLFGLYHYLLCSVFTFETELLFTHKFRFSPMYFCICISYIAAINLDRRKSKQGAY